ncbi:RibD family protein, partial [Singulisphaera rosea]
TGRPYVTAKWAMTLDGKTATSTGDSRWISGPRSRSLVHETRGRMDAILVGIGTAQADDPELTARPPGPRKGVRIVLDSAGRLSPTSKLVQTARDIPVWVAVTQRASSERLEALKKAGCEILAFPGTGSVPVVTLLEELGRRGMTNLLVEGGGRVLGAFLDAGQVDAVDVFIAPLVEGGTPAYTPAQGAGHPSMDQAARLERHDVQVIDGDIRIVGTFAPSWRIDE